MRKFIILASLASYALSVHISEKNQLGANTSEVCNEYAFETDVTAYLEDTFPFIWDSWIMVSCDE